MARDNSKNNKQEGQKEKNKKKQPENKTTNNNNEAAEKLAAPTVIDKSKETEVPNYWYDNLNERKKQSTINSIAQKCISSEIS